MILPFELPQIQQKTPSFASQNPTVFFTVEGLMRRTKITHREENNRREA